MALILNIETATQICSVALADNGKTLLKKESSEKNAHSSVLTLFIDEIMKTTSTKFEDLDAVSVSKGPGSYTGLRIGVSSAKGLCFALDIPLISVSTLQAMAFGVSSEIKSSKNSIFCPMIDARRMEVYNAFFDVENKMTRKIKADILDENYFDEIKEDLYFFGDGAAKCKELFSKNKNIKFIADVNASAENMALISEQKFINKDFEDVALFEPLYLKDFIPGKPRVKGLY